MKSVHTILSSLLAGMMMFSLAACTASGTGASGSDSSAVQTDAVPQGRWVERQADGISSGLVLGAAPAALADGSLVLYARDESTDMPVTVRLNSTDNGASWQSETLDWAEKTGTLARWAARRGVYNHRLHPVGRTIGRQPGSAGPGRGRGEFLSQPDGVPARWHPGGCPVRRTGCFSAGKYSVL